MEDAGDPNYLYWPYIPSADFFEKEMTVEERQEHEGHKKYRVAEHEQHVRDIIAKDQQENQSWSCGGF
jgi:hypothetical protein